MQDIDFYQPGNLEELAEEISKPGRKLIAGGTDLIPQIQRGKHQPAGLVDMSKIRELQSIRQEQQAVWIGSLCTHAKISSSAFVANNAQVLSNACASIGCRQTRYRGTLGGNIANGSPAADTAPALLVLGASVHIASKAGHRIVQMDDFFSAPAETCLATEEYIDSVQFNLPGRHWGESFLKIGRRNGMAIAVVSVAVHMELDDTGNISFIRVAAGSVAPTPVRCRQVELYLEGRQAEAPDFKAASEYVEKDISPIDDIRATRSYRRQACQVLVNRTLMAAWQQAKEKIV